MARPPHFDLPSGAARDRAGPSRRSVMAGVGLSALALAVAPGRMVLTAAATENDTLKVIYPAFSQDWSPIRGGGQTYRLNAFWWASPLYYDGEGQIHPYVFTSWTSNAEFTEWVFTLDPAAKFSDGSPITADEVKGSWEIAAVPATKNQRIEQVIGTVEGFGAVQSGAASTLSGVSVKDEKTLVVRLSRPDPIFFAKLANQLAPVIKASAARDETGAEIAEWWRPENGVAVSGPFAPVSIDLDAGKLVFERNPHFFGPTPKLARVEVTAIEDQVAATLLLKERRYDLHTLLQTATVVDDLGADFVAGPPAPEGEHFWFNVSRAPTDDPKVRLALIKAIDRDGLIKASYPKGPETKADQILHAVPGVDPNYPAIGYDPEGAKKLLAESRYKTAAALPKLNFVGIARPAHKVAAQYIAEQWRQVLGIEAVDMKPQIDAFSGPDQAQVQIFRDSVNARVPDATAFLLGAVHSGSSNAKNKLGGYKNAEVDTLLEQASVLALDDPKRIELAQRAQVLAGADALYIPWIYRNMPVWAMPWVKGVAKNADWQVFAPWAISIES
ncbi:ABC transporter substrate-binding protein [Prosthecomicrobium pneumaticum]|uniref:Peptide/nickel transport system substrate-binding protein n=1 Tax=Prosthecomicrobium pneumaticum TaxID=81895 RepID=A0A7W9CUF5_9HYPH|nr:ABC transporter substrate-binding protein [Prosthecomicrobium pneumaticum]MBB5752120.1 peptide/nickel transport system substrate-binding protein [Prosthecomicrobium pneumaticum]